MKTNRLITREGAAALHVPERVKLERQITDARARAVTPHLVPRGWRFEDYRNRFPWRVRLFDFLGPLDGQVVLDLGCGFHPTPVYLALAGAKVVYACDVSAAALACVREVAAAAGVSDRVVTIACAGEQLPLPDNIVDSVHGEAVLHHLHIPLAGREIVRVLKSGGRAAFKDPLGHNALLEFARDHLPYAWKHAAKGTDRPLTIPEIQCFGSHFSSCAWQGFGLLSMLAVLACGPEDSLPHRMCHRMDRQLLRRCPSLQRFCRFVVTCVEK